MISAMSNTSGSLRKPARIKSPSGNYSQRQNWLLVSTSEQVEINLESSFVSLFCLILRESPLILLTASLKRSMINDSGIPFAHMMMMNCLFKNAV
jgi:hypothetical protein